MLRAFEQRQPLLLETQTYVLGPAGAVSTTTATADENPQRRRRKLALCRFRLGCAAICRLTPSLILRPYEIWWPAPDLLSCVGEAGVLVDPDQEVVVIGNAVAGKRSRRRTNAWYGRDVRVELDHEVLIPQLAPTRAKPLQFVFAHAATPGRHELTVVAKPHVRHRFAVGVGGSQAKTRSGPDVASADLRRSSGATKQPGETLRTSSQSEFGCSPAPSEARSPFES